MGDGSSAENRKLNTGDCSHAWRVLPVQIAAATSTYAWSAGAGACEDLRTLCEGTDEAASPLGVFLKARKLFRAEGVGVAFLPSYSPARFFALFAAAKSLGIRTVMMNESHAGTEQATGFKRWIKRQIVKQFDAAFVGGEPHKRHFASLGIPADKIFTGYDAVDNALFAAKADEVRSMERTLSSQRSQSRGSKQQGRPETEHLSTLNPKPSTQQSLRSACGLPQRYFLSLGRMVEKKNLSTLVEAYARFARASVEKHGAGSMEHGVRETVDGEDPHAGGQAAAATKAENCKLNTEHCPPGLVFVGSGELEDSLREQARGLGLLVVDRTDWRVEKTGHGLTRINTDESERLAADRTAGNADGPVTWAVGEGPQGQAEPRLCETGLSQNCKPNTENSVESDRGAVYFYGFRQIEENPVFYALAEAFILPSLKEEWGLVVNEAMAAGLPVIVSHTAGCAEDLVPTSGSMEHGARSMESGVGADTENCRLKTENSLEQRSNGFVFDPKSSDALSEALRRIAVAGERLEVKGNDLEEIGQRSREIVAKFSCENFARQALRAAEAASA
jgi:glycosyltransferase involved in cell wall biosynthesis